MIGVYADRPVEGWSYDHIRERFDQIKTYVNDQVGMPLHVPDDDLSGTFTFLRCWRILARTYSRLILVRPG